MRTATTVLIALLATAVLLSGCSRNAAQDLPTSAAEACVTHVQAQYERTSQAGSRAKSDAHETAILLCKF